MEFFSQVAGVLSSLAIIWASLVQIKASKANAHLLTSKDSKKKTLANTQGQSTHLATRRSDVVKLLFGMGSILLATGNLSVLMFGPGRASALTTGDAASISISLILAFSAFMILKSG